MACWRQVAPVRWPEPLTQMRASLLVAGLLACGCNQSPQYPGPSATLPLPTLDEAFAKYSNDIAQAQQGLPTDKWEDKPLRRNVSSDQRVSAAAKPMFEEITLRLKGMSVTNLVRSFKVIPYPYGNMTNDLGKAAEYAYVVGNQLIINEIKTRPPEQLRGLRKLGSGEVMIVEGPQGFGLPLTYDLQEILDEVGLTNGLSR